MIEKQLEQFACAAIPVLMVALAGRLSPVNRASAESLLRRAEMLANLDRTLIEKPDLALLIGAAQ